MKVSIIVPVYNVYLYIDKCLDSLVHQTLKDIEIILVNDGSPDKSEEIIKKYMKKYKNIKYFKKENGGMSSARNYGLEYATGEYIGFVDSDDYVTIDMYEKMYEKAKSEDFDMVSCDINYVYPKKEVYVSGGVEHDNIDIKKLFINNYPAVWNKIFKKEIFDTGIRFKCGVWFEDVEFIYRVLAYVKKVGVIHEAFNQYVQRDGSITHTVSKKIYDYIDNMNTILDFYKEKNMYLEYQDVLEYVYVRYLYATFIRSALPFDKKDYMDAVNCAIENVNKTFPHYKKNKYFYKSIKGLYLVMFNKMIAKILYIVKGR